MIQKEIEDKIKEFIAIHQEKNDSSHATATEYVILYMFMQFYNKDYTISKEFSDEIDNLIRKTQLN